MMLALTFCFVVMLAVVVYVGHSFVLCWCQLHVHRNTEHDTEDAVPACELTLKNLQLDYLDLYLVRGTLHYRGKGMCVCVLARFCVLLCVFTCVCVFKRLCMSLCVCVCVRVLVASGLWADYHPAHKCQPRGCRS